MCDAYFGIKGADFRKISIIFTKFYERKGASYFILSDNLLEQPQFVSAFYLIT